MGRLKESLLAYALLSPALLLLGFFGIFPVGYALYVSLHKWLITPGEYVGFLNYQKALGEGKGVLLLLAGFFWFFSVRFLLWLKGHRLASSARRSTLIKSLLCLPGLLLLLAAARSISHTGDPRFLRGLRVTTMYAIYSIPLQLSIALGLAYLLHQKLAGKGLYRTVFFLPYVTPIMASAIVFRSLMTPRESGVANRILGILRIKPLRWLSEDDNLLQVLFSQMGWTVDLPVWLEAWLPSLALASIIFYNVWVYVGYDMLIFMAGLTQIPPELLDAAAIDGANRRGVLRHVILPLLSPTLYFLSVIALIGTFKAFNHIYVLRTPSAQGTADTASILIFDTFFKKNNAAYASCLSLLLFAVILSLTLIQRRLVGRRVFYG